MTILLELKSIERISKLSNYEGRTSVLDSGFAGQGTLHNNAPMLAKTYPVKLRGVVDANRYWKDGAKSRASLHGMYKNDVGEFIKYVIFETTSLRLFI